MTAAPRSRRYIHSLPGESIGEVAQRAMGSKDRITPEQYEQFLAWNIHLSRGIFSHLAQQKVPLLPSEIVYVEAPIAPTNE